MTRELRALRLFHYGEVFGESMYWAAARIARDHDRSRKLARLAALEAQTKQLLASAIDARGGPVRELRFLRVAGAGLGALIGALPERASLAVLERLVRPALDSFERYARSPAGARDPDLAQALVMHERAQDLFVRRERHGVEGSLEQVDALLGR